MAVLGRRHWYRYESDDGKCYKIKMLDYLAEAGGFELDDTSPELPRGLEPRSIWLQESKPNDPNRPIRKKLIVSRKEMLLRFKQNGVEVAGIKMSCRTYRGESRRGGRQNNDVLSEVRVKLSNDTNQ